MELEVQSTKNDGDPLRVYLALETMQQNQLGTGDKIVLRKLDHVKKEITFFA